MQRPRISHTACPPEMASALTHVPRVQGRHERQLRACACRGDRVVACHVTRVHMQRTGREGRLKS